MIVEIKINFDGGDRFVRITRDNVFVGSRSKFKNAYGTRPVKGFWINKKALLDDRYAALLGNHNDRYKAIVQDHDSDRIEIPEGDPRSFERITIDL